jgi:hypothetical protein
MQMTDMIEQIIKSHKLTFYRMRMDHTALVGAEDGCSYSVLQIRLNGAMGDLIRAFGDSAPDILLNSQDPSVHNYRMTPRKLRELMMTEKKDMAKRDWFQWPYSGDMGGV